ncbi:hypothetical protein [Aliagarivorans taiwanensis]|uniref:hypothetical protein n=1 Tax=Aliagarivorans taiwanensis TaxID=561966 RepID=UPI00041E2A65|nr:hypothetical protein [Aliagarivorans taiwanensis]
MRFFKLILLLAMLTMLVRCDIQADLYKASNNSIHLTFPRMVETPIFWLDKEVGQPLEWGFNAPWSEDYQWRWLSLEEQ